MKPNAKARTPLFDLDLLKAIVMVADCGTFTAASQRLHSTQSTVSQKVRRLEDMAGHKLLERGSRDVSPTDAGETLLAYARRMLALNDEMIEALSGATVGLSVRLGVPEDFVGGPTTHMLAAFNRKHPQVKLEVTSGLSRDVGTSYDRGDLDLILVKQRRNSREAVACWPEQLRWIDSAKNPSFQLDPIPIVAFPPRGLYRDDMTNAIEGLGRRWRMSFISSSLSGIQAAVADGLGISLLPARSVTADHAVLTQKSGLPSIETMDIALLHRPTADTVVKELARALARMFGPQRR
ncbi:LysR family transcriptional regulator [Paraburkholderia sp. 1N]|uniref:LysR family transcriptional regulator n=1 Tax=Paraburkholderia solitsugae TaxID=2675748 RepID=A0ABX2BL91_9BURK|nr:LysR family transcriptional regulator [Paraburkholderia solitsugae]NPT40568.1 LysR family transcriptional regulator [Paraburkholderia solitsugae]